MSNRLTWEGRNRITWEEPKSSEVHQFEIRRAAKAGDEFVFLTRISAEKAGFHWYPRLFQYFFDDADGDSSSIYQILAYEASGYLVADSGPFQPAIVQSATLQAFTKVDSNYGGKDELQYVATSGMGIPNAEIRIYNRPDYEQGRTDLALFRLETDNDGRWLTPVYLPTGLDYVVWFAKTGLFGPNTRIITV